MALNQIVSKGDDEGLDKYLKYKNIDELREYIGNKIEENNLTTYDLVTIAKVDNETATLIKEIVNLNQIDDTELANQIARDIIACIEHFIDEHLEKYGKYTLDAHTASSSDSDSTRQFFNLIGLLKDVSVLGRKLLESSPQFNSSSSAAAMLSSTSLSSFQRPRSNLASPCLSDKSHSRPFFVGKTPSLRDEDATSEDLLAALIESSSTDDFLVLSSSLESITIKDMILAALIYIKSHECFTLSHDIQGVAIVLRRAKFIILNILAPKNQMELITKLLTSIGRYNEMTYVFDLFRDRNQFEILLSKGVEKTPELRIALFNYVKKNPEFYPLVTLNFSMFREIAESLEASALKRLNKIILSGSKKNKQEKELKSFTNKFPPPPPASSLSLSLAGATVASAVAALPSSSSSTNATHVTTTANTNAITRQESTSSGGSSNSTNTTQPTNAIQTSNLANVDNNTVSEILYSKEGLNLSLVELVDASDCYAKAGCYKKSNYCERKAKLIALQLALLLRSCSDNKEGNITNGTKIITTTTTTATQNVLNVSQSDLNDLIMSFESFQDAYIVAEAYDCHLAWRQALFTNVILRGKSDYLEEYCKRCDLSKALVGELVLLYRQYINQNHLNDDVSFELRKSLKMLLVKLKDVELKCRLYSQLNFDDAKEELIRDPAIEAHLKDLKLA